MFRRLKYWLLFWLMDDICKKSNCRTCKFDVELTSNACWSCNMPMIYEQARKAWKIGGNNRG